MRMKVFCLVGKWRQILATNISHVDANVEVDMTKNMIWVAQLENGIGEII